MNALSMLFATSVVPPVTVALVLAALLLGAGLHHWQQSRPRFAPIFVRVQRPDARRARPHRRRDHP